MVGFESEGFEPCALAIASLHRFVLSTRIRGSESIVNLLLLGLWTLDARVVVETLGGHL